MPIISYIRPSKEYATLQEAEQRLRLQADIAKEQQLNKALTGAALGGFSDLMMKRDPNYQRMQQLKEKILSRMLGEEAAPGTSAAAPLVGDADGLFPRFDDVNPILADVLRKTYEPPVVINPAAAVPKKMTKPEAAALLESYGIWENSIDDDRIGELFDVYSGNRGDEIDIDLAVSERLKVDPDERRAGMLERLRKQGVFE